MKLRSKITLSILTAVSIQLSAGEIWVSPNGNDRAKGSVEDPKATLTGAFRQAREWRRLNDSNVQGGIYINLAPGVHALYEAVFIRPEDSGTAESPTVVRASSIGESVLSGGVNIENWKRYKGNIWVADVPEFNGKALDFRQLWVNGDKAVRARNVVDFEQMDRIVNNDPVNEILWVPSKAVRPILNAPNAELVIHQMWCIANLRIKSIKLHGDSAAVRFHNPESRLQFETPWPRPMVEEGRNSAFYLTNAMELLDQPGEWYHDIKAAKLYYYPLKGEDMRSVKAIVPAVETLMQVEGTLDRPVSNIRFEGVTFSHTTWMRPSEKGHVPLQAGMFMTDGYQFKTPMARDYDNHLLDNQGWLGRPSAAVQVEGAHAIDFSNCSFTHIGSTALDYVYGVKGGRVEGCLFRDIAGNGLVTGSFSPKSHETHVPYDPSDHREVCSHQYFANNYFTNLTNEDWGGVAILAGYVRDITIEHNEISDVSYTGISLGWGWTQTVNCMRNNRILNNHIHRFGRHMYDVAGIYTLGSQPKSEISGNSIHSIYTPRYVHDPEHWFYLYTDEGSSFIEVKNNWTEGEKFLKNANGPGNNWENNGPFVSDSIKLNAGLTPDYKYLLRR